MPLEPGPFGQAPATAVQFTAVKYGFADYTTNELADVDTTLGFMDSVYGQLDDFGIVGDAVLALPDLEDVALAMVTQVGQIPFVVTDSLGLGMMTVDALLAGAIAFAPPQAWVTTDSTFVPPDVSSSITTPSLPLSAYNPTAVTPVGVIIPGNNQVVSLFNLTRVGQSNFWVGDNFVITISAAPGADVSYDAYLQGTLYGTADLGTIPASGTLQVTGQMAPEYAGAWREDWFIDGKLTTSLNFVVLEAS